MASTQALALPAPDPAIALWLCQLTCSSDEAHVLAQSLSPLEIERANRFGTPGLRARWIAGRAALRQLLGAALGVDPAAVALRRGTRGRPELAVEYALDFNVSHTEDVALIGIAAGLPAAHDRRRHRARRPRRQRRRAGAKIHDRTRARRHGIARRRRASPPLAATVDLQGSDEQGNRRCAFCAVPRHRRSPR